MGAKYLIRFDDICPTMNWLIWEQVDEVLASAGVKPILAVIPDNQDPKLRAAPPNLAFWNRVRAWQARGWTIGLHGHQHLATTRNGGVLKINKWSEFSGLTFDEQRLKLQRALQILEGEGVRPELWIAPAHSFDAITLRALEDAGIRYLSDGFSIYPYCDSSGMMWVPQQLWRFRRMRFGVWTVCNHVNRWSSTDLDRLRCHLLEYAASLTDWNSVTSQYRLRKRSVMDRLFSEIYPAALKTRHWLQGIRHSPQIGSFVGL